MWLAKRGRNDASATILAFLVERQILWETGTDAQALLPELRADPSLAGAFARGAEMTREEAVAYALALAEDAATLRLAASQVLPR